MVAGLNYLTFFGASSCWFSHLQASCPEQRDSGSWRQETHFRAQNGRGVESVSILSRPCGEALGGKSNLATAPIPGGYTKNNGENLLSVSSSENAGNIFLFCFVFCKD